MSGPGFAAALQDAVLAVLEGSAALAAILAPKAGDPAKPAIYDEAPQPRRGEEDSYFPYLTLGEDTLAAFATDTATGADVDLVLHSWSRAGGWREVQAIDAVLRGLLHRQEIAVAGAELIGIEWDRTDTTRDPDGHLRHGVHVFRVLLDEEGWGEPGGS